MEPCTNMATYEIKEGHIQKVDMKGVVIIYHQAGIGPKVTDLAAGVEEGAVYMDDRASDEQKSVLEPFVREHLGLRPWKKLLGVKFAKIDIMEDKGSYHITMPSGEQKLSLTTGGDGENPIRLENPRNTFLSNVKFCKTEIWRYFDYGKVLEYHNTSGVIADFAF